MVERLGLDKDAVALHWYDWDYLGFQEGNNDNICDNVTNMWGDWKEPKEGVCGFDTHYPEYFPPRLGFESAL